MTIRGGLDTLLYSIEQGLSARFGFQNSHYGVIRGKGFSYYNRTVKGEDLLSHNGEAGRVFLCG